MENMPQNNLGKLQKKAIMMNVTWYNRDI